MKGSGLQTIFGIFLGLMVTAFVGVGVYTFYPSPEDQFRDRIVALDRQEQTIRNSKANDALTSEDRAALQRIISERNRLNDSSQAGRRTWGRRTSIVLIAFATLAMAISLIRADQLPVLSNGLLLGGVFTMLYGVGWIIVTDTSVARFAVITVALVITLGLGYVRFVRRQPAPMQPVVATSDLEQRVRRLEQRLEGAAAALGRDDADHH